MLRWIASLALCAGADRFVVLRPGTEFLPPAQIQSAGTTEHPECCSDADRTVVARLIAEEGERLQIETLGVEPDLSLHCGVIGSDDPWFPHQLSHYRIRLWVSRKAVL